MAKKKAKKKAGIPPKVRTDLRIRLSRHVLDRHREQVRQWTLTFRGRYAYVEVWPSCDRLNVSFRFCRLTYRDDPDRWGLALYEFSSEAFEDRTALDGSKMFTPEEAFDTAASVFLGPAEDGSKGRRVKPMKPTEMQSRYLTLIHTHVRHFQNPPPLEVMAVYFFVSPTYVLKMLDQLEADGFIERTEGAEGPIRLLIDPAEKE